MTRPRKPILHIPAKCLDEEHHETQRLLELVEKHRKREREEV